MALGLVLDRRSAAELPRRGPRRWRHFMKRANGGSLGRNDVLVSRSSESMRPVEQNGQVDSLYGPAHSRTTRPSSSQSSTPPPPLSPSPSHPFRFNSRLPRWHYPTSTSRFATLPNLSTLRRRLGFCFRLLSFHFQITTPCRHSTPTITSPTTLLSPTSRPISTPFPAAPPPQNLPLTTWMRRRSAADPQRSGERSDLARGPAAELLAHRSEDAPSLRT